MNIDIYDIIIILGILLLGFGLWLFNPVVSLCVIGVLLILLGIKGASTIKKGGGK